MAMEKFKNIGGIPCLELQKAADEALDEAIERMSNDGYPENARPLATSTKECFGPGCRRKACVIITAPEVIDPFREDLPPYYDPKHQKITIKTIGPACVLA